MSRPKEWLTIFEAARHLAGACGVAVSTADVLRLALAGKVRLSVNFINPAPARRGTKVPIEKARMYVLPRKRSGAAPPRIFRADELPAEVMRAVEEGSLGRVVVGIRLSPEEVLELDDEITELRGLWDLPLIGGERFEIERRFQSETGGPEIRLICLGGAYVEGRDGVLWQLQERRSAPGTRNVANQVLESAGLPGSGRLLPAHVPGEPFTHLHGHAPAQGLPTDSLLVVRAPALLDLQERLLEAADFPD